MLASLLPAVSLAAPEPDATIGIDTDEVLTENFFGFGIQWDPSDIHDYTESQWENFVRRAEYLSPNMMRVMLHDVDSYAYGFRAYVAGTDDPKYAEFGRVPLYNFESVLMKRFYNILDVAEDNNIGIIIGEWNGPNDRGLLSLDSYGSTLTWDSKMWHVMIVDMLEHLTKPVSQGGKGYTCVKYFNMINEPNFKGNTNATWSARWMRGIKSLRDVMNTSTDAVKAIGLCGPDVYDGWDHYLNITLDRTVDASSRAAYDYLDFHELHWYINPSTINNGSAETTLRTRKNQVYAADPNAEQKTFGMAEIGMLDGKTNNDQNLGIRAYEYGIHMFDLAIQMMRAGLSTGLAWSFEDSMHLQWNDVINNFNQYYGPTASRADPNGSYKASAEDGRNYTVHTRTGNPNIDNNIKIWGFWNELATEMVAQNNLNQSNWRNMLTIGGSNEGTANNINPNNGTATTHSQVQSGTLNNVRATDQNLRPWYYAWSMICRYLPNGSKILDTAVTNNTATPNATANVRATSAVINREGNKKDISIAIANRYTGTSGDRTVRLSVPNAAETTDLNVIIYKGTNSSGPTFYTNQGTLTSNQIAGPNGDFYIAIDHVIPNADLREGVDVTIPANSSMIVTTMGLSPDGQDLIPNPIEFSKGVTPPPTAVSLALQSGGNSITVGTASTLRAVVSPGSAAQDVTWEIVDYFGNATSGATVNGATSQITASAAGTYRVTARAAENPAISATIVITASPPSGAAVRSVSITGPDLVLVGSATNFTASVTPTSGGDVTWTVVGANGLPTTLASINATTGVLTPAARGSVVVVATAINNTDVKAYHELTISSGSVTDDLRNFNMMFDYGSFDYERTPTNSPTNTSPNSIKRGGMLPEEIIYSYSNIQSFQASLSTESGSTSIIEIWTSPDNILWTQLPASSISTSTSSIQGVSGYTHQWRIANNIPPGTNFIKLVIGGSSIWSPQLTRVQLTYDDTYTEDMIDMRMDPVETIVSIGQPVTLLAKKGPANSAAPVVWSSDNESVATVSQTGVVTAHILGSAVITAKCGDLSAVCTVSTAPADLARGRGVTAFNCVATSDGTNAAGTVSGTLPVASATANGTAITNYGTLANITNGNYNNRNEPSNNASRTGRIGVNLGSQIKFDTVRILWEDAYPQHYNIESANTFAANTTAAAGNFMIHSQIRNNPANQAKHWETITFSSPVTAQYAIMRGRAGHSTWGYSMFAFEVYDYSAVKRVVSFGFDQTTMNLELGQSAAINEVDIIPADATFTKASFTTSNPAVAVVRNRRIVAVGVGTATITGTIDGKTATCLVTVVQSSACDIAQIVEPSGALYDYLAQTITHTVNEDVTSQAVYVNVSSGATWALYSDEGCANVITNRTMILGSGATTAYIKVSAQNGVDSKIYAITIIRNSTIQDARTPVPGALADVSVEQNSSATLAVTVTNAAQMSQLSYQWYESASATDLTGTPIPGAQGATFSAPTGTIGTKYYFCEVTNTDNDATGSKTSTAKTNIAKVEVLEPPSETDCFITGVVSPAGAAFDATAMTIKHEVPNSTTSQVINVNVNNGASWALYSDVGCLNEISDKTMTSLVVGPNVAYVKVVSKDGSQSSIYTVTITRQVLIVTVTDNMENWSKSYDRDAFDFEPSVTDIPDPNKIKRGADGPQGLIYSYTNILSFTANVYEDLGAGKDNIVEIWASADNLTYTKLDVTRSGSGTSGWLQFAYTAQSIPDGTNFIKLVINGGPLGEYWRPQVTQVTLTYADDPAAELLQMRMDPVRATVEKGKNVSLTAKLAPANAHGVQLAWTSSDDSIATVDQNGLVSGINVGSCIIIATSGNAIIARADVSVTSANLALGKGVTAFLFGTGENVANGATATVSTGSGELRYINLANITNGNIDNKSEGYSWGSLNTSALRNAHRVRIGIDLGAITQYDTVRIMWDNMPVSFRILGADTFAANTTWAAGNFQVLASGAVPPGPKPLWNEVTFAPASSRYVIMEASAAQDPYGYSMWSMEVYLNSEVVAVTSFTLEPAQVRLYTGDTSDLNEIVAPADASFKYAGFTTSDPGVAIVRNRQIIAVSPGTATITATLGAFTSTCIVTVIDPSTAADYSALDAALLEADGYVQSKYTQSSWEALEAAVAAGEELSRDLLVGSQELIDQVTQAILDAIGALEAYYLRLAPGQPAAITVRRGFASAPILVDTNCAGCTFTSAVPVFASVSSTGVVTGLMAGITVIRITDIQSGLTVNVAVNVVN